MTGFNSDLQSASLRRLPEVQKEAEQQHEGSKEPVSSSMVGGCFGFNSKPSVAVNGDGDDDDATVIVVMKTHR